MSLHFLRSSEEASSGLDDPIGDAVILASKKKKPIVMEDSLNSEDDDWKYEIGSSDEEGDSDSLFDEKGVRGGKKSPNCLMLQCV